MKYVVRGQLLHGELVPGPDGKPVSEVREYNTGDTFESDDDALVARLRRDGVLQLPTEANPAQAAADLAAVQAERDQLAAERDAQASRAADLEAQLAAILAQQGQPDPNP